jgi:ATP-binding cassette, subfamily F, member 3
MTCQPGIAATPRRLFAASPTSWQNAATMSLASISDVSVTFGGVQVLEDVSLEVHPDSRIGIVGANGSGKTTLLRILLGEAEPDAGTTHVRRGIRVEWLRQESGLVSTRTPHEIVLEGFADVLAVEDRLHRVEQEMAAPRDDAHLTTLLDKHSRLQAELEALGGYEAGRLAGEALSGLGVPIEDHGRPVSELSGGQHTRVALARVLVREPDLLVLDEPTNHLDVEATEWLETRLAQWRGAFIVVSHDRYFLDRVARIIGDLEAGRFTEYPGTYSDYVAQREIAVKTHEKAYDRQRREIEHDEDFIRKNLAAQRVSMARGRQKKIARLERVAPPPSREKRRLRLDLGDGGGGQGAVLVLDSIGHAYEEDRWLFRNVDFRFERGERIGIIGPNGGGKTTLLRVCAGLLDSREGSRREGPAVRTGVFEQDRAEIDPALTPLEVLRELDPRSADGTLRSWLGRFRIGGDDALRPVGTLSGGEVARVALACLLYAGPNTLFLDEPTNHLDIPAREALEDALNDFPGSLLIVSHDRRLLDGTVSRILLVDDGKVREFSGGYTAFQEQLKREREQARAATEETERRRRAERHKQTTRKAGPKKPRITDVEAAIIEREERLEKILEEMGAEHVYRNAERMRELTREKETIETELENLNAQWSELAG